MGALDGLAELLARRGLPEGPFDPRGDWRMAWTVLSFSGKSDELEPVELGHVRVEARRGPEGSAFMVQARVRLLDGMLWDQDALIHCAPGWLPRLRAWSLESRLHHKRRPGPPRLRDGWEELAAPGAATTCDWLLPDLVQRLEAPPPGPFELLESLVVRRRAVTLEPLGHAWLHVGARARSLTGWCLRGQGMVPSWLWRDEAGRLLARVHVQGAWLLDEAEGL